MVHVLREVHNRVAIGVLALLQDGEMLRYLSQYTPSRPHKGQPDPGVDPDLAKLLPKYVSRLEFHIRLSISTGFVFPTPIRDGKGAFRRGILPFVFLEAPGYTLWLLW